MRGECDCVAGAGRRCGLLPLGTFEVASIAATIAISVGAAKALSAMRRAWRASYAVRSRERRRRVPNRTRAGLAGHDDRAPGSQAAVIGTVIAARSNAAVRHPWARVCPAVACSGASASLDDHAPVAFMFHLSRG